MEKEELLKKFVDSRNNSGKIIAAFGYGSRIFRQTGYSLQKKAVIDTIFVVENPHLWHQENIQNNPKDYSLSGKIALKYFDINAIKKTTGVTYQTDIEFMQNKFKYGVIGKEKFIEAMYGNWESLLIQGRFQKPIYTIFSNQEIDDAIKQNRQLALFVALLTLQKENPTLTDLYYQICSLSYKGDLRMLFAENPNKVYNIVDGCFENFLEIYGSKNLFFYTKDNGEIDINKELINKILSLLPYTLYEYLQQKDFLTMPPEQISKILEEKIVRINRKDSIAQPLTALITSGPVKSLSYLSAKMKRK